jgi:2-hydroxychromene-2-carboxylate isomerase
VSSLPLDGATRSALVGALFQAVWARGLHVSDAAVVAAVAGEIGLDGARLVADAETAACKDRLRRQTDEAIARGVFGVPSMEIDGELFWGFDDFPQLERHVAGDDPLDAAAWQPWADLRPSAARARRPTA